MSATAIAYSNIALIKYWGKADSVLNLPSAGSISATLAPLRTTTSVSWTRSEHDTVQFNGERSTGRDLQRIVGFLDLVRTSYDLEGWRAEVRTENSFPTAAGLASSASGFAALALAATAAADLDVTMTELSALARRGSGSAARSLHGGFVRMNAGSTAHPERAVASQIAGDDAWDLRAVLALTTVGRKKVSSTVGMNQTQDTSPYFDAWIASVEQSLPAAEEAINTRNFQVLAKLAEASALQMHASAIAAVPGVLYWNGVTVELIHLVRELREEHGVDVFFTIDAGPHVKIFTTPEYVDQVDAAVRKVPGVVETLHARIGGPAHLVDGESVLIGSTNR